MTISGEAIDGRAARSARTRQAVVEALLALIREGDFQPSARQISERAGVSLRSVYVHFDDIEDLFLAAAEHQIARVAKLVKPVPVDGPTVDRVHAMCDVRASVFEEGGGVRRAADLQSPYSPKLADFLDRLGHASRASISDVFANELDTLDARTREERVAALDAMLSARAWEHLRKGCGFSFGRARQVFVDTTLALLAQPPGTENLTP